MCPSAKAGWWNRQSKRILVPFPNDAERIYDKHYEWLAVVWAVLLLQPYREGSQIIVRTDHDALKLILNLMDSTGKLERWQLRLSELKFDHAQLEGIKH